MKIAVVMLYDDGRKDYGDYTSAKAEAYCNALGYTLIRYRSLLNPSLAPSWNKLLAVQQELHKYDWIFWMDADALILNHNTRLESFIEANTPEKEIIFSSEALGLCAGVFLVRNTPWATEFIRTVLFLGEEPAIHNLYEQTTIRSLYKLFPSVSSKIGFIAESAIQNHRSVFSPDAFMMHFWASHFTYGMVDKIFSRIEKDGWAREHFPKHYFCQPHLG
jgi:hypothetical protein